MITKEKFIGKVKELELENDLYSGHYETVIRAIDIITDDLTDIGFQFVDAESDSWIEARYYNNKLGKVIILDNDSGIKRLVFEDITDEVLDEVIENINWLIEEKLQVENKIK